MACNTSFDDLQKLTEHMERENCFSKVPDLSDPLWKDPQYLFPAYENDPLLTGFEEASDDEEDDDPENTLNTIIVPEKIFHNLDEYLQKTLQPPLQPQQQAPGQSSTAPQPPQGSTAASQGYSRTDNYDSTGYSSTGYYNYPPAATATNYPPPPHVVGGSNAPPTPYNHNSSGSYGNIPSTQNKPPYDRVNNYGEGSGNSGYNDNKNQYGDSFSGSGGAYKPRDNVRDTGYGPSPKETVSYDNYGSNRGAGDDGSYKDYNEDSVVHKSTDTIYISNLSKDVTEEKLANFFGGLGKIKIDKRTQKPKIWIYYDKVSGIPKGDATLTYEDPDATAAAINWFHNKEFLGQLIKVEMSVRKLGPTGFRGGSSGRGPPPRDGDWACESCNANNFARRTECYKCHTPRSDGPAEESGHGGGRHNVGGSTRGGYRARRGGPPSYGGNNSGRYNNEDDRGYGNPGGYGRQSKQDDRRDNSRYRPY
ncbi:613_t:CDS:10 [Ambispora gerdemannii]|uniref:613_t:CDS:1 n=1 Tax=Ambispora gerdemannii TaxID=144530 RepID=A0A9N9FX96_9GLOM|nr:613_t:CDS:10 [Ambispora gerdemannii]